MKARILPVLFLCAAAFFPQAAAAFESPSIKLSSSTVVQGEPVLVTFAGVAATSTIRRATFDGTTLGLFVYRGAVSALIGIDLYKKAGTYKISATLSDGTNFESYLTVAARTKVEAPLGIPEKLGGNTTKSQATLVSTLASENAELARIKTGTKSFWTESFRLPLKNPIVTDSYGYSRQTGAYSIAHKGTDFRAKEGVAVMAVNRGVVRIAKTYRNYGKTVVVDHGLGVMSFYMHLSKIHVSVGQLVLPNQTVGLSGMTGYAEQPHLHLTIRINGTSIDPMVFFGLLQ